jgi:hypothetical protein
MDEIRQHRRATASTPDVFLHESKPHPNPQDGVPAGHEVAGLIIVRDDGTCTVAWGRGWGIFDRMPGVWPNVKEAKQTVQRVIGHVEWTQTEARIWEGRLSLTAG